MESVCVANYEGVPGMEWISIWQLQLKCEKRIRYTHNQKCLYSVNTLLIAALAHCITEYHWPIPVKVGLFCITNNNNNKLLSHHYYEVIISFTEVAVVTLGPLRLSLMSLRKTERFWVNLSLFFVNNVLSIPSIKFSNLKRNVSREYQATFVEEIRKEIFIYRTIIGIDPIEPGHHGGPLVCLLRGNHLIPQVLRT